MKKYPEVAAVETAICKDLLVLGEWAMELGNKIWESSNYRARDRLYDEQAEVREWRMSLMGIRIMPGERYSVVGQYRPSW